MDLAGIEPAQTGAGLPQKLGSVLRAARLWHSRFDTGNLKAVMLTMGHKDVKTAMRYQHPEVEVVRQALNQPGGPI